MKTVSSMGINKGVKPSFVNPYFLDRRLVKSLGTIRYECFTPMREPVVTYSRSSRLPVFSLGEQALQAQLFSFTISTFYIILFVFNSRCKDTQYFSFDNI